MPRSRAAAVLVTLSGRWGRILGATPAGPLRPQGSRGDLAPPMEPRPVPSSTGQGPRSDTGLRAGAGIGTRFLVAGLVAGLGALRLGRGWLGGYRRRAPRPGVLRLGRGHPGAPSTTESARLDLLRGPRDRRAEHPGRVAGRHRSPRGSTAPGRTRQRPDLVRELGLRAPLRPLLRRDPRLPVWTPAGQARGPSRPGGPWRHPGGAGRDRLRPRARPAR